MDNAEIARPHIWTRKKQKDGLNLLDKTSCGARAPLSPPRTAAPPLAPPLWLLTLASASAGALRAGACARVRPSMEAERRKLKRIRDEAKANAAANAGADAGDEA